jgi:hypothetical protein
MQNAYLIEIYDFYFEYVSMCHHRVQAGSWGPLNLLSNGYQGSFPGGKATGA